MSSTQRGSRFAQFFKKEDDNKTWDEIVASLKTGFVQHSPMPPDPTRPDYSTFQLDDTTFLVEQAPTEKDDSREIHGIAEGLRTQTLEDQVNSRFGSAPPGLAGFFAAQKQSQEGLDIVENQSVPKVFVSSDEVGSERGIPVHSSSQSSPALRGSWAGSHRNLAIPSNASPRGDIYNVLQEVEDEQEEDEVLQDAQATLSQSGAFQALLTAGEGRGKKDEDSVVSFASEGTEQELAGTSGGTKSSASKRKPKKGKKKAKRKAGDTRSIGSTTSGISDAGKASTAHINQDLAGSSLLDLDDVRESLTKFADNLPMTYDMITRFEKDTAEAASLNQIKKTDVDPIVDFFKLKAGLYTDLSKQEVEDRTTKIMRNLSRRGQYKVNSLMKGLSAIVPGADKPGVIDFDAGRSPSAPNALSAAADSSPPPRGIGSQAWTTIEQSVINMAGRQILESDVSPMLRYMAFKFDTEENRSMPSDQRKRTMNDAFAEMSGRARTRIVDFTAWSNKLHSQVATSESIPPPRTREVDELIETRLAEMLDSSGGGIDETEFEQIARYVKLARGPDPGMSVEEFHTSRTAAEQGLSTNARQALIDMHSAHRPPAPEQQLSQSSRPRRFALATVSGTGYRTFTDVEFTPDEVTRYDDLRRSNASLDEKRRALEELAQGAISRASNA